jgi:putative inorganic carbon (HCO3(-)) transporter
MATAVSPVPAVSESSLLRFSRWMLFVTVAAMPLYVVRWHYGPLPTTLLETLILITVAGYVVARWREGRRRPVATPLDLPIVLLLLAGAISVVVAGDHRAALGLYRAYFIEAVAVFYIAVDVVRRAEDVQRLVLAFAIGSALFAALNLFVFTGALLSNNVHIGFAPSALYGDANPVAMYLDPPFAMAVGLVLFANSPRWRWVGVAWFAVVGAALLATFSKGGYLAVGALALMAVLSVRRWGALLLAGAVASALLIAQIPLVAQRLGTIPISIGGRLEIYRATLQMIRNSPIFGVGLGGYSYQFRGEVPEIYPHDIWLTFWVEIGLLGLIAFAVILFWLLWRGWRAWPRMQDFYRPALWGSLGSLVMWIVHGLVDSPYWKNDMSVEFWTLSALIIVCLRAATRVASPGTRPGPH